MFVHDASECEGCGECMRACPTGVLLVSVGYVEADASKCRACGACDRACPASALRMEPKRG
ncbi:4Fe-4S binding protein [Methanopyrus sp. KOL6]|uniref:4Fe-4S binding protein n=1 Tax=Methanopyrus sp. KOL6 TaxID=1937004 RepID=UPI000B4A7FC3|nr:4Fe-4S binding protein [Methanopyrus sp. KOL6]